VKLQGFKTLKIESSFFSHVNHFVTIGSNFTKADTSIRSRLAITKSKADTIYELAKNRGLRDFVLLSTCNRTEFYACTSEQTLKELLIEVLALSKEDFETYFYVHHGVNAVRHFFRVTTGLDSQIIGDYEIAGQVKKAIQQSRALGMTGTLIDRISNYSFQASKEVKTKTNLSSGKYSVSYAAAELITSEQKERRVENILIVGTGEIGQAMARNMKEYFPACELTLTNRTLSHAEKLAEELQVSILPFENFTNHLSRFDAVITTVESEHFLIRPEHTTTIAACLFLDLSMPQVVDPAVQSLPGIKVFSVDEISAFHNELMKQRSLEIPKAEIILEEFIARLMEWQNVFYHRGIILTYKTRIEQLLSAHQHPTGNIEKEFSGLIQKIKVEGYRGCSVLQTVNELIAQER
jgi:glutamyl-tRNA reductase